VVSQHIFNEDKILKKHQNMLLERSWQSREIYFLFHALLCALIVKRYSKLILIFPICSHEL
jgi:hypothetical protein